MQPTETLNFLNVVYRCLKYFSVVSVYLLSYKPQGSRDITHLQFGTSFSPLFFLLLLFFLVPYTSTNIKLITEGFLFYVWREHALQSGQHASYTENEHDATDPVTFIYLFQSPKNQRQGIW